MLLLLYLCLVRFTMAKLLFVTLVVTLVTIVTLPCHPDVTVFCSLLSPPPPIFVSNGSSLAADAHFCALFLSLRSKKAKSTKRSEPKKRVRCRLSVDLFLFSIDQFRSGSSSF